MQQTISYGNPSFDPQKQVAYCANQDLLPIPDNMLTLSRIADSFLHNKEPAIDPMIWVWNDEKRREQLPYVQAATLMPLVQTNHGLEMLLTKRSRHLKKHSGQISFPGGRIDKDDLSAQHAALRETTEEIGIEAQHLKIIGKLPDFFTGTGFLMQPFVANVSSAYSIQWSETEVEEVFSVPLSFLLNPNHHYLHEAPLNNGKIRQYFSITWKDYFIWGATAAVIRNFYYHLRSTLGVI